MMTPLVDLYPHLVEEPPETPLGDLFEGEEDNRPFGDVAHLPLDPESL